MGAGANPTVSFREDDERAFLSQVERRAVFRADLNRRGAWHGRVAELEPQGILPPNPRRRRREALRRERWIAARPIVLRGLFDDVLPSRRRYQAYEALRERLLRPEGLAEWLASVDLNGAPEFRVVDAKASLFDPERDVARVSLSVEGREVWLKTGRLSNARGDASLRLRFAFGREGDDDASEDFEGHRLVAALARRLWPEAERLVDTELARTIEDLLGAPVLATQHIAYWNAPDGGAAFHHDAFADDVEAQAKGGGQRGVSFAQLDGSTFWLALSIEDLADRVREFVGYLAAGDMPWLVEELFGASHQLEPLVELVRSRAELLGELSLPSCGAFGPLVDRGPEFTSFLTDAGHGLFLHPGDAVLLPNHGLLRTAMHSVFCASDRPTFGLSMALRLVC